MLCLSRLAAEIHMARIFVTEGFQWFLRRKLEAIAHPKTCFLGVPVPFWIDMRCLRMWTLWTVLSKLIGVYNVIRLTPHRA
jgi:hypothetical protein